MSPSAATRLVDVDPTLEDAVRPAGEGTMAVEEGTIATGEGTTAMGEGTTATGEGTTAIGEGTIATGKDTMATGAGAPPGSQDPATDKALKAIAHAPRTQDTTPPASPTAGQAALRSPSPSPSPPPPPPPPPKDDRHALAPVPTPSPLPSPAPTGSEDDAAEGSQREIQTIMEQFASSGGPGADEIMSPRLELAGPLLESPSVSFPPRRSSLVPVDKPLPVPHDEDHKHHHKHHHDDGDDDEAATVPRSPPPRKSDRKSVV